MVPVLLLAAMVGLLVILFFRKTQKFWKSAARKIV